MASSDLHRQLDRALSLQDNVQLDGIASGSSNQTRQDRIEGSHRRSRSEQGEPFGQRRPNDAADNRFKLQRGPRLQMASPYSSPERNGPRSPQYESPPNLRRRVGELQTELDETREALTIENRVARKRETEIKNLSTENSRLRAELEVIRAVQSFTTSGSEPASEPLIQAFENLNLGVLELGLDVSKSLHPDDLSVQLHPSSVDTFLQRNDKARILLGAMLTRSANAGVTIQEVIVPLCQCIVNSFLAQYIFWPFFPGLIGAQNQFFYNLRERIYSQQSQEKAARWRSITYQAAASDRNDDALGMHMTKEFFALLADLLRTLLPPGNFVAEDLFPKLAPRAAALVVTAMVWQDTARTQYTSRDYDVFFPISGAAVLPEEMELTELGAAAGKAIGIRALRHGAKTVLLPLSLGLRATRSQTSSLTGGGPECRTISKANVLAM